MEFELFIPGPIRGKQRPFFIKKLGIAITPKQTVSYENLVKIMFREKYPEHVPINHSEPLEAVMIANYGTPASTSKKKKDLMLQGIIRPTKTPDVDNITKVILDGLNKIAYDDDRQFVDLRIIKKYSTIEGLHIKINTITNNQTRIEV